MILCYMAVSSRSSPVECDAARHPGCVMYADAVSSRSSPVECDVMFCRTIDAYGSLVSSRSSPVECDDVDATTWPCGPPVIGPPWFLADRRRLNATTRTKSRLFQCLRRFLADRRRLNAMTLRDDDDIEKFQSLSVSSRSSPVECDDWAPIRLQRRSRRFLNRSSPVECDDLS